MTGWELTVTSTASLIVGLGLRELPAIIMDKVFLRDGNGNGKKEKSNGTRLQFKEDVKDVFEEGMAPMMQQQTGLLTKIADSNAKMSENIAILVDRGNRRR